MQRPLPWKELLGDRAPVLRSTTAMLTSLTALAATSLIAAPSAVPLSESCTLRRTQAHHSEGLDTWNSAYPRPTRDLDAVLVFLSFPDAAPLTTPAELTADHFPATSEFFERASYGKFALRSHPRREWLEMPQPSTAYAIRRDWNATHRAAYLRDALATADPHVDFSRYDIVYFVADPHAPGVDSDATKVVNLQTPLKVDGTGLRRVVTVFERHPPDRLVLAHETGHVFDLPDLYRRPADGKGDWDTHVGDWDLMGSQFALAPDLFAWHKWKLGWLEPHQVTCVHGAGTTRLTLEAVGAGPRGRTRGDGGGRGDRCRRGGVRGRRGRRGAGAGADIRARAEVGEAAPGPGVGTSGGGVTGVAAGARGFGAGRGTKLAVVRTGPDSALGIEARGAVGNDASVCTQGVLVYRIRSGAESGGGPMEVLDAHPRTEACWEESVYPPLADAPVGVGESFTVPGEAVRVDVEGRTTSGAWTVRITTGR
ncbi:M6 family metalloprotease domain-containing protein [Streptomyces sp. MNU76]|uniref:M6 family metalloprotease domain-containing protein n=1 Tax=Streptomyces sp. MNU76 TaxID=2560026 RepID=UPI001E632F39|nr:M6 family metalloprotease domain-containing protein [Streptomyces sp. MNU76]MCC9703984.1 M6 family metalloprotease domain-containing protein [Streptomyces sp. MNU76]